jgi:hypothetical protein
MANAYSTPQQFNEYQNPYNLELINGVLAAKQGSYDKNLAVLDENLAQLKTQEGLLLRDKDKEYFNNKVQGLLNEVGRSGQIDLSSNNVTRKIKNYINDAQDEYIIDQIGESQKFRNFQMTVEETKKRGKGEGYNDINYVDAIERGGLQQYLNGETDSIGSLQYKEYIDAPKVINDEVAKWAKDYGYRKEMSSQEGEYYTKDITKEVLTKDEITKFIQTTLSPQIKEQLQINTRQTYKNLQGQDLNNFLAENYKRDNIQLNYKIAQLKSQEKSAVGEQKEIISSNIRFYEDAIEQSNKKIDTNDFSRDELYSIYEKNLFDGIADSYDRDAVIDIDYDTTKLEVMKFQADMAYKAEDLKLKKYALDNKNSTGVSNDLGTAIPTVPENEEEKPSAVNQVTTAFKESNAQLMATLEAEDEEYRNMPKAEKEAYVIGLMKNNNGINPMNRKPLKASVINAVSAHKANYEAYSGYRKGIGATFDKVNRESYDDILGAVRSGNGVKVDNLAYSMPSVSKFLKSGRSFNNLTEQEKEIVRYEMTASAVVDGELGDNKEYQMYLNILKQRNRKNPQVLKVFDNTLSEDSSAVGAFFSTIGRNLYGGLEDKVLNPISESFTLLTQGKKAADKVVAQNLKESFERNRKNTKDSKVLERWNTDYISPYQDTNITEIEGFETASGKDLFFKYKTDIETSKTIQQQKLQPYLQTMPAKMAFSFSTENKGQQAMADLIKQTILAREGATPADKNNYELNFNASTNQYTISYLVKDGKNLVKTPITVDASLMPKVITDKYSTSKGNWATDIMNPKATAPTYNYESPRDYTDTERIINNLNVVTDNGFSDKELLDLTYNPIMLPLPQRVEIVLQKYPTLSSKKEELAKTLSSPISVEIKNSKGVGFYADVFKTINGQKVKLNTSAESMGTSYNPTEFVKKQMALIGHYTNLEVEKLISK